MSVSIHIVRDISNPQKVDLQQEARAYFKWLGHTEDWDSLTADVQHLYTDEILQKSIREDDWFVWSDGTIRTQPSSPCTCH